MNTVLASPDDWRPLAAEIVAQAAAVARLLNVPTGRALRVIEADCPPVGLPGREDFKLLRALYLTAALRLGMSLDVALRTIPKVTS
jgi:hypothetical protein